MGLTLSRQKESYTPKKKKALFNLIYVIVGVLIAGLLLLQLMFNNIIDLENKKVLVNSGELTTVPSLGQAEVTMVDRYESEVKQIKTYSDLNGTIQFTPGNKTDIVVVAGYNSGTPDGTVPPDGAGLGEAVVPVEPTPAPTKTPEPTYSYVPGGTITSGTATLGDFSKTSTNTYKDVVLLLPVDKQSYIVGSRFGDVVVDKEGLKTFHMGYDFITQQNGATAYASVNGAVVFVGTSDDTIGLRVVVQADNGDISIVYGSLSTTKLKVGDRVVTGDIIGTNGKIENIDQAILHYEIFDTNTGNRLDPEKFSFK